MAEAGDFIALAAAGVTLRTRDRRAVTLTGIDVDAGLIRGSVALEGALAWRQDGSFAGASVGDAGPLDLVVPNAAAVLTQRASLQAALNDEDAKDRAPFCCD